MKLGAPPLCGGGSPCRLGWSASVPVRPMPAAGSAGPALPRAFQSSLARRRGQVAHMSILACTISTCVALFFSSAISAVPLAGGLARSCCSKPGIFFQILQMVSPGKFTSGPQAEGQGKRHNIWREAPTAALQARHGVPRGACC